MYKAVSPDITIRRIQNILKQHGIKIEHKSYGNDNIASSVRITIANGRLRHIDLGTNGKGMTMEYALASAYGELMERIENKMFLFAVKYASPYFHSNNEALQNLFPDTLRFRYFPDETYRRIGREELCILGQHFLPHSTLFTEDKWSDGDYDMPFVPFYNFMTGIVEDLPYDMIRLAASSTGLCAGNTAHEAILQGVNEIFERYALQRIYLNNKVLPSIPPSRFDNTEIGRRIEALCHAKGWRYIIKDCLFGIGLPVLGLLIIDDSTGKYTFRLGADCNMEIALQRCFTEIFQGTDIDDSAFIPFAPADNWDMKDEFEKNVINGRGQFPSCIFICNNDSNGSFDEWRHESGFEKRFSAVLQWLRKYNLTLYVRDNSFMGFPAYHIYIPGLSDTDCRLYDIRKDLVSSAEYYKIKPEFRMKAITAGEAEELVRTYIADKRRYIPLFTYSWSPYNYFDKNLLIALLSYRIAAYSNAYEYMKKFLEQTGKYEKYYYCIRDYFALLSKHTSPEEIHALLGTLYTRETADSVLNDMADRDNVLRNFPLPECFNCRTCKLKPQCGYDEIIQFEALIQNIQADNPINQIELSTLAETYNRTAGKATKSQLK